MYLVSSLLSLPPAWINMIAPCAGPIPFSAAPINQPGKS
jgi:hypothetical protein